jgi:hypothetical protein
MKESYVLLRSIKQYLDNKGNLYNMNENGNVDDSEIVRNIMNVSGVWWKNLSPSDYDIAEIIWRTIWDK